VVNGVIPQSGCVNSTAQTIRVTRVGRNPGIHVKLFGETDFNPSGNSVALKGNVCSRGSEEDQFALHVARVLNRHEARNQIHAFYLRASLPRARCLTLALPPDGGGPGSQLRFTNVTVGCPRATRARVGRRTTLERLHAIQPFRLF